MAKIIDEPHALNDEQLDSVAGGTADGTRLFFYSCMGCGYQTWRPDPLSELDPTALDPSNPTFSVFPTCPRCGGKMMRAPIYP